MGRPILAAGRLSRWPRLLFEERKSRKDSAQHRKELTPYVECYSADPRRNAGGEWICIALLNQTLYKLPGECHLRVARPAAALFGRVMPFWYFVVFALSVAECYLARDPAICFAVFCLGCSRGDSLDNRLRVAYQSHAVRNNRPRRCARGTTSPV